MKDFFNMTVTNVTTGNELEYFFRNEETAMKAVDFIMSVLRMKITDETEGKLETNLVSPFGEFEMKVENLEFDNCITKDQLSFLIEPPTVEEMLSQIFQKEEPKQEEKKQKVRLTGGNLLESQYLCREMTQSQIFEAIRDGFSVESW